MSYRAPLFALLLLLCGCLDAPHAPEDCGPLEEPSDECDDAEDPYLDSDGDGWPDCADCAPNHVQIPRWEDCPEVT